jgi:hypothetical protein
MMLDLLTPTDHAGAYEWASVFLAHIAIGLCITALVAAVLDAIDNRSEWDLDVGTTAPWLVTGVYLVAWEMGVQRLGAGWPDALVDTLAVGLGGLAGLFLWRRAGVRLAVVVLVVCGALWRGIRGRK